MGGTAYHQTVMAGWSLLDLFQRLGSRPYDAMYRRGAPWESGPRPALVELCETGRVTPDRLAPGRAIDLGCGTGADSLYLAARGFDVTGVDFSEVAVARSRSAAAHADLTSPPRFVVADLLALPSEEIPGPFDLLFDGGTLDDFPRRVRPVAARRFTKLARPGSTLVMWCFYARDRDLPFLSLRGPSRWGAPAIAPGEEVDLFGEHWEIERYEPADAQRASACFVMTRR